MKNTKNIKEKTDYCAHLFIAAKKGEYHLCSSLLQNGANIDFINSEGCTAIYVAAENGHLNIVKLLNEHHANLNIKYKEDLSVLEIAAFNGHLDIIKYLLKQNVQTLDTELLNKILSFALYNNYDLAKILESYDISFHYPVGKLISIPIREIMISNKPIIDNRYKKLLKLLDYSTKQHSYGADSLLKAAINDNEKMFDKIIQQGWTDTNKFIVSLGCALAKLKLKKYFTKLYPINKVSYPLYTPTEDQQTRVQSYFNNYVIIENFSKKDNKENEFNLYKTQKSFENIYTFLSNKEFCISILEKLNKKIKDADIIDLTYTPKVNNLLYLKINNMYWPCKPSGKYKFIKKNHVLSNLLLKEQQQDGINLPDSDKQGYSPQPKFAGFIDPKRANKIVNDKHIFLEFSILGNSLIHGKYTHSLQWFIIAEAARQGKIDLCGYTVSDLLRASVSKQFISKKGETVWSNVLDSLKTHFFSFADPHQCQSFLLRCEELHYLRAYLLDNYYHTIDKLKKITNLSYEEIVQYQALSRENFDGFETITSTDNNTILYNHLNTYKNNHLNSIINDSNILWKPDIKKNNLLVTVFYEINKKNKYSNMEIIELSFKEAMFDMYYNELLQLKNSYIQKNKDYKVIDKYLCKIKKGVISIQHIFAEQTAPCLSTELIINNKNKIFNDLYQYNIARAEALTKIDLIGDVTKHSYPIVELNIQKGSDHTLLLSNKNIYNKFIQKKLIYNYVTYKGNSDNSKKSYVIETKKVKGLYSI